MIYKSRLLALNNANILLKSDLLEAVEHVAVDVERGDGGSDAGT